MQIQEFKDSDTDFINWNKDMSQRIRSFTKKCLAYLLWVKGVGIYSFISQNT